MTVAGCGQVDSGISVDFESEGNVGLVNFQQSVCCEVYLGLKKKKRKKDEFVCLYYYYFWINRITIMIINHWSRAHSAIIISLI